MTKFIFACIVATAIGGQFAMASTAPMYSSNASATDTTQDAPYQVAKLQGEVKTLQEQVQVLLSQSQAQSDESTAELDSFGTGG
jgi:peptidoglycan hydrolase CwlO-like protein